MTESMKLTLANKSTDATYRFQPFQLSSELVEKVDQLNQPKMVFSQCNTKNLNQKSQKLNLKNDDITSGSMSPDRKRPKNKTLGGKEY